MRGKKKSSFMSALSVIITLLLIVLAVGLVFKYTKAGDEIKGLFNPAFRVEYNGIDYSEGNNAILLPASGQARFKVKGADSYKLRVTPNVTPETDFSYEIGNEVYMFGQADLNKFFITDESVKSGNFIIDCTQDLSVKNVLSSIHGGAEIVLNGNADFPYLLTFSNGKKTVRFIFGGVLKILFSPEQIVF